MKVIGVNSKKFSRAAAARRAGRQRHAPQDRIAPDRGRGVPHDRARLRRRPALSRAGSRRRRSPTSWPRSSSRDRKSRARRPNRPTASHAGTISRASAMLADDGRRKLHRPACPAAAKRVMSCQGYVCYASRTDPDRRPARRRRLENRPLDRRVRRHRGRRPPTPSVPDPGQDALGRQVSSTSARSWKSRTSGAPSPSTTRSSSRTTTSRSSSTPTATTTSITRSRSTRSIPSGTCSSRSRIATAARRSTNGRSPA